jgi:hypothetical protein
LKQVARAVHTVTLPPVVDEALEYYLEAETVDGLLLRWPAPAPKLNQAVVVMPK